MGKRAHKLTMNLQRVPLIGEAVEIIGVHRSENGDYRVVGVSTTLEFHGGTDAAVESYEVDLI
jgi:hypothetical protein